MDHGSGLLAPGHISPAAPAPAHHPSSLSRDQFLGLGSAPARVVMLDLPGGEGRVGLRSMTGLVREKLEQGIGDGKAHDVRARMAVASLCDEHGNLLMGERDIEAVNKLPWTMLDAIYRAALELNGMGPGAVDAAAKN